MPDLVFPYSQVYTWPVFVHTVFVESITFQTQAEIPWGSHTSVVYPATDNKHRGGPSRQSEWSGLTEFIYSQ